jgi:cellulose synthase/poly-beta-1,6-N-acetylglucosamine synthase-like glycosyltransferase
MPSGAAGETAGTSNHLRVNALLDVALRPGGQVWDPHNLTEDADFGAWLAAVGYRVDLLPSITMEQAPVKAKVVDKQQRRWKVGYLQTGLVHTGWPLRSMRRMGPGPVAVLQPADTRGATIFLLNPLFVTYRRMLGVCGAS